MSWINTIPYPDATGPLKSAYNRIMGPDGHIDNILTLHSLRPHTLDGHMRLYKNVLHHSANSLPKWWLETIGVYVSLLNRCEYCVEHHFAGLQRLLDDNERSRSIRIALEDLVRAEDERHIDPRRKHSRTEEASRETAPRAILSASELETLLYVRILTLFPHRVTAKHVEQLRAHGIEDGEILEINQVSSYFAYANRTVLGLGCTLENGNIGLSPGDSSDPENWNHS
jgi:AhpD family alkylhydroperoxidase